MGKQLQIKQLNPSGQLLNSVNCYSGQISVFRAATQSAIQPYINALAGVPGPDRFVIEIDHEPYLPHQHSLIGFGERFSASDSIVEDYLILQGVPENILNSMLTSYGLEESRSTPCVKLSRCEERRLRILGAIYQKNRILIINDPFEPISFEWRERFADLIVNFARSKSEIVVVPHLSYRPECWIDNEFISRIQVGENLQKTIGLASQAVELQSMLTQLRQEQLTPESPHEPVHHRPVVAKTSEPMPKVKINSGAYVPPAWEDEAESLVGFSEQNEDASDTGYGHRPSRSWLIDRRAMGIGLTVLSVICLVVFGPGLFKSSKVAETLPPIEQELAQLPPVTKPQLDTPGGDSVPSIPEMLTKPATQNDTEPEKMTLVMRYPPDIRESIIQAVNANFVASQPKLKPKTPRGAPQKNQVASDFLKLLETAGSDQSTAENESPETFSGYDAPTETAYEAPPQDEQIRREQIRQKFLEAIQRAQERSN